MMDLQGKTVLLVSPEPWDRNKVSKHHYALEIASRGAKVFFLNPPGREEGKREFRMGEEVSPGIHELFHQRPLRALRFYPALLRRMLMKRQLRRLEEECGVEGFDLVWSFEASRFFDFSVFGEESLRIFHMVDLVQDHNLRAVCGSADLVLCTTSFIEERLRPYARELHKIPHGHRPASVPKAEGHDPKERLRIGYLGNLRIPYLDEKLMLELPRRFPDVDFHFIGPKREEGKGRASGEDPLKALERMENVKLPGLVPSEEVPSYLAKMDILLILYDSQRHFEQVAAPHKMMEYLASGKAVVATWMEEHREHRDMIRMVKSPEEFIEALGEVLHDLEYWNSEELQEQRRQLAREREYGVLLQRILQKAETAKPSFFQ